MPGRASAARRRARRNCWTPRSRCSSRRASPPRAPKRWRARAGVSKGTLYLYYPSKEELFKAVVRHNLSSLIAEGEELACAVRGQQLGTAGAADAHLVAAHRQHAGGRHPQDRARRGAQLPRAGAVLHRRGHRPGRPPVQRHGAARHRPRRVPPHADARGGACADGAADLHGRAPPLLRRLPGARRRRGRHRRRCCAPTSISCCAGWKCAPGRPPTPKAPGDAAAGAGSSACAGAARRWPSSRSSPHALLGAPGRGAMPPPPPAPAPAIELAAGDVARAERRRTGAPGSTDLGQPEGGATARS